MLRTNANALLSPRFRTLHACCVAQRSRSGCAEKICVRFVRGGGTRTAISYRDVTLLVTARRRRGGGQREGLVTARAAPSQDELIVRALALSRALPIPAGLEPRLADGTRIEQAPSHPDDK